MPNGREGVVGPTEPKDSTPRAHADWFELGQRRMAIVTTNTAHPETGQYQSSTFLRDAADTLKREKGWEYGSYKMMAATDLGWEEVQWDKDPKTGNPVFVRNTEALDDEQMRARLKSYGIGRELDDYLDKPFDRFGTKPEFDLD